MLVINLSGVLSESKDNGRQRTGYYKLIRVRGPDDWRTGNLLLWFYEQRFAFDMTCLMIVYAICLNIFKYCLSDYFLDD